MTHDPLTLGDLWERYTERPIFEVRDAQHNRTCRIWVDGRIEGFGAGAVIINRIPTFVKRAIALERTMNQPLSIGRIVHYRLSEGDVDKIRSTTRVCNPHTAGQVVPAIVVTTHGPEMFNGQAFIDGAGTLWLTSVPKAKTGVECGHWFWPPRVADQSVPPGMRVAEADTVVPEDSGEPGMPA